MGDSTARELRNMSGAQLTITKTKLMGTIL